ncbi:GNAT family N-acetyltransferase [Planomonospora corallina]|uniref:GNAT family N-acetyltransferase n=1 Tax=Planomonospora corallina TaxID=1806052 RepID=A0ABV8I090_9ACTN
MDHAIRDYAPADEGSWLRCRVLSFLGTAYFDDVMKSKPVIPAPGFQLVATGTGGDVTGIMDVTVDVDLATIDTVAVHPDHQHQGIGRALLSETRTRLGLLGVPVLDAWTREDPETLRWYRSVGFTEREHYLHVYADHYADPAEPGRAVGERQPRLRPVKVFLHADLRDEQAMRERFTRVHVCRRFVLDL